MKVLVAVPLVLLALLGAGGMSSLEDDDFCRTQPRAEGTSSGIEIKLLPPGWRCTVDGRTSGPETGSWPWFLVALAGEALVAAWYLRRRTAPSRMAAAATVALATAGAFGLIGGFAFGFAWSLLMGMPLAWLVCGRDLVAALVAGAAVLVAATLALLALETVAACFVAVALAATAGAIPAARLRPAR